MNHSQTVSAVEMQSPGPSLPLRRFPLWQGLGLSVLVALLYYPVLAKLVRDWWNDPNFSHGFIVPLFSAFLVWHERERLRATPLRPSWQGLPIILFGLGVLVVGSLGAELFLSRTSLLILVAGLIIYFAGWEFFRALFFPWIFLFLMIPIPAIIFNQITFPLQLLASKLASAILPIFGVPVLREGNVIYLPSMPLQVAEACSGIRSLMSLGTLAIIYAYFLDTNIARRIILVLAAVPIAVAANALRIVGTGLAVQYWDPEKGLGFFHEFSGWVIFCVSVAMLFLVHAITKLIIREKKAA